jgi:hypothetical protein
LGAPSLSRAVPQTPTACLCSCAMRCAVIGKSGRPRLASWLVELDLPRSARVPAARSDTASSPEPRSLGELTDRLRRSGWVARTAGFTGRRATRQQVAVALRGPCWQAPLEPVPPVARTQPVTAEEVEREAAAARTAFTALTASVLLVPLTEAYNAWSELEPGERVPLLLQALWAEEDKSLPARRDTALRRLPAGRARTAHCCGVPPIWGRWLRGTALSLINFRRTRRRSRPSSGRRKYSVPSPAAPCPVSVPDRGHRTAPRAGSRRSSGLRDPQRGRRSPGRDRRAPQARQAGPASVGPDRVDQPCPLAKTLGATGRGPGSQAVCRPSVEPGARPGQRSRLRDRTDTEEIIAGTPIDCPSPTFCGSPAPSTPVR